MRLQQRLKITQRPTLIRRDRPALNQFLKDSDGISVFAHGRQVYMGKGVRGKVDSYSQLGQNLIWERTADRQ